MVKSTQKFGDRFEQLKGGASYQAISDGVFEKTGIRISPQAMHLWVKAGGDISAQNLRAVADYFGVREAWLRFGEGNMQDELSIEQALAAMSGDDRQAVLDFIEYKLERSHELIAKQKLASYMKMLDRIKVDMATLRKKGENTEQ